jgi:hypothetical protein
VPVGKVLPIEKNIQVAHDRYRALGGPLELVVVCLTATQWGMSTEEQVMRGTGE